MINDLMASIKSMIIHFFISCFIVCTNSFSPFFCCQICQLAESNSDAIFLKVNYEQHKKMCQALHIHVLPFFRFYRSAQGKICSFSCTNATVSFQTMIFGLNKTNSSDSYFLCIFKFMDCNSFLILYADQEIQRCVGQIWY